jgi:hypothetical protein
MIQRIQSIYLLFATLCYSFFLLFPIFKITTTEEGILMVKATENIYFLVLAAILIIDSLATVFFYKNRKKQMLMGWVLVVVNLFLAGLICYHYYIAEQNLQDISVALGAVFPFISIVLLLLAIFNINKDEKLVKSLDRLR